MITNPHIHLNKKSCPLLAEDENARLYELKMVNALGSELVISSYGLTIQNYLVKDKSDNETDIVLGCAGVAGYIKQTKYIGSIVGPFANRIAQGKMPTGNQQHLLSQNSFPHHLHGGEQGLNTAVWLFDSISSNASHCCVTAILWREAGIDGYPGNTEFRVKFVFLNDNSLEISVEASCDADTHINLTHHTYFNLTGMEKGDLNSHLFRVHSNKITEVNEEGIPTGKIMDVTGMDLDFSSYKVWQDALSSNSKLVKNQKGIDHNYVFKQENNKQLRLMAEAFNPANGIKLEVSSTQPGMQFYSGQHLGGQLGRNQEIINDYSGFCFEPQHFPDTPNQPEFPSTLIKANELYSEKIVYKAYPILEDYSN